MTKVEGTMNQYDMGNITFGYSCVTQAIMFICAETTTEVRKQGWNTEMINKSIMTAAWAHTWELWEVGDKYITTKEGIKGLGIPVERTGRVETIKRYGEEWKWKIS